MFFMATTTTSTDSNTEQQVPCCTPVLDAILSEDDAADLAKLLKALADPIRLRIVSIIAASPMGEICTCDLPALLDRSQPTISHHLSLLSKAGLVEREQRGKWAWFRVAPDRLDAIGRALRP
jgi:ArsR family transcriptional regulator